jgi:hypothetical protein
MKSSASEAVMRLSELGGARPIPEWRELSWTSCWRCGGELYGPADEDEVLLLDEPIVCGTCGVVSMLAIDVGTGQGYPAATGRALRWSALAGFRRLLGFGPPVPVPVPVLGEVVLAAAE